MSYLRDGHHNICTENPKDIVEEQATFTDFIFQIILEMM